MAAPTDGPPVKRLRAPIGLAVPISPLGAAGGSSFPAVDATTMGMHQLFTAISDQDWHGVRAALQSHEALDLSKSDAWQRSPLMLAVSRNNVDITAYLLSRGANPTIKNRYGDTPISRAMAGVDAFVQGPASVAPVIVTLRWRPAPGAAAPSKVQVFGSFDQPPFSIGRDAVAFGDGVFATTMRLLPGLYTYKFVVDGQWMCATDKPTERTSEGHDNNVLVVSPNDDSNSTLLERATASTSVEMTRLLLSHRRVHDAFLAPNGHTEYVRNALGETLLHVCARSGNLDVAKLVLSFESFRRDLSVKNLQQDTAEDVAATPALRALFVEARVGTAAPAAAVSLSAAVELDDPVVLQRTVAAEASELNMPCKDDLTPLMLAAQLGRINALCILLYHGANPGAVTTAGDALSLAVQAGRLEAARMLLSHDLSHGPHKQPTPLVNKYGENLLHFVARAGSEPMAKLILGYDAFHRLWSMADTQGRVPPAMAINTRISNAFQEARTLAAQTVGKGPPTPVPLATLAVCSVCMVPMPYPQDQIVHECECKSVLCEECFVHLAQSWINSGVYPTCCSLSCKRKIPYGTLAKHLPRSQHLTLMAMLTNEDHQVTGVFRQNCPVCCRVNDLEPIITAQSPTYQCQFCKVTLCPVCGVVAPSGGVHDGELHAHCREKLPLMSQFLAFHSLLQDKGLRKCSRCDALGVKDEACTHMHCDCGNEYCFVCGREQERTTQGDIGSHGAYDRDQWENDPEYCPMYLTHLAFKDDRIRRAGCGELEQCSCLDNGLPCAQQRDNAAQALLFTMRVRYHILNFAAACGKEKFIQMLTTFKWQETVDANYFNNSFPWSLPDYLPHWAEFEPDDCREFYLAREQWIADA